MTTPDIEPAPKIEPEQPIEAEAVDAMENAAGTMDAEEEEDERRRRKLLFLLILLLVVLCCVCGVIARYLLKPQPLPEMILPTQVGGLCYAPTYKFSIDNVDGPVAVAVSPNNERRGAPDPRRRPPPLNPGGLLAVEVGHIRANVEAAFPQLDFNWPELEGGEDSVFLLSREQLVA